MPLLWVLMLVVSGVVVRRLMRRARPQTKAVRAAHLRRIETLPEYQKLTKQYQRWLWVLAICLALAMTAGAVLSARPASQTLVTPAEKNRDIMLCLDVSGSMREQDLRLIETFELLAKEFDGQRIGLDVFNGVGAQVFPVTDDYELVRDRLAFVKNTLLAQRDGTPEKAGSESAGLLYSVLPGDDDAPSSNVGLGLAGCIQHMGETEVQRSRSIILATDNELGGERESAVISTSQAMAMAASNEIRVYTIDPGVYDELRETHDPDSEDNYKGEHALLRASSVATGGSYYRADSLDVVPDIINRISAQEETLFTGDAQLALTDATQIGYIALVILVIGIQIVLWRLKL